MLLPASNQEAGLKMAGTSMLQADGVDTLTQSTPREARRFIAHTIQRGRVPMVVSSPGIGKSALVKAIAQDFHLQLIDERLSTRSPVDLSGMPDFVGEGRKRQAQFTPFNVFPTEDTELPKGKDGWLLFLDEFNSATKATQAAAYKLILDRMVGLHRLHPNVAIVAAGNLMTDRAIVNPMSTAMQSRLIHIRMTHSHDEWLEDVALAQKYDSRIIAYLNYKPSALMDFRPNHNEATFCCPRTWEFVNDLITGLSNDEVRSLTKLLAGSITSGVATDFISFIQVYQRMITFAMIMQDPHNAEVPVDNMTRWAVICHMMEKVTDDTFGSACTYVRRFPIENQFLFFRSVLVRRPEMRRHPEFINAMSQLSRYFHSSPYAQAA